MNETTSRSEAARRARETPPEALEALPIFPLPGTILLPQTMVSLHIFEPRYRRMMEDVVDGHRLLAIAMLDENRGPDLFGRPPVFPTAGVGVLRRATRLPDGRYNIMLEGLFRADISEELDPVPFLPFRRVRARPMVDIYPDDAGELENAEAALRSLCARVVLQMAGGDEDIMKRINEIEDPGVLADMVAAAAIQESPERQKLLAEMHVVQRLEIASAALGALVLRASTMDAPDQPAKGWGIAPGKA